MDKKKIDRLLNKAEDQMRNHLTDYEKNRNNTNSAVNEQAAREKKEKQDTRAGELDTFVKENRMRLTKAQKKYALNVDWGQFGSDSLSVDLIKAIRNQYKQMQDFLDSGG